MQHGFLKQFIGITAEDTEAVVEMGRILSQTVGLDRLVEMVYERLLSHPETARYFQEQDMELRQLTLAQYLGRLVEGRYGFDYAACHTEVGRKHLNVEVPLEYLIATYGWVRSLLPSLLLDHLRGQPEQAMALLGAFNKALDFDLCLLARGYRRNQAPVASQ